MGAIPPNPEKNKLVIEAKAKKDNWQGQYLPFGNIHYMSLAIGCCIGAIATVIALSI